MAVDANVIIFSRIKEEIARGKTPRVAVQAGFKRAKSTVIDSQVTTLIAAIILYQIGTSAVKGFAWTLLIGIVASLFTAVVITQLYLSVFANSKIFSKKSFYGVKENGESTFKLKKSILRNFCSCDNCGIRIRFNQRYELWHRLYRRYYDPS